MNRFMNRSLGRSMVGSIVPWRLVMDHALPPPMALAVDEAIALSCIDHGGRATLRFYRWDRPAVSIGRYQPIDLAVRAEPCRAAGVPVLRRITGGRAVWHHHELTYSIICPLPSPLFPPALMDTVAVIGRALASSLQHLGLPVDGPAVLGAALDSGDRGDRGIRTERGSTSASPFCFDEPSWYEVTIGGKKVIGSAQRRWRDRFLQQGSILLRHDAPEVARWLPVGTEALRGAAGLEDFLPEPIPPEQLAGALAHRLASIWNLTLEPGPLTAKETALAETLARDKYSGSAWTMRGETSARS
jgi:lipoate-protein ligase A